MRKLTEAQKELLEHIVRPANEGEGRYAYIDDKHSYRDVQDIIRYLHEQLDVAGREPLSEAKTMLTKSFAKMRGAVLGNDGSYN